MKTNIVVSRAVVIRPIRNIRVVKMRRIDVQLLVIVVQLIQMEAMVQRVRSRNVVILETA